MGTRTRQHFIPASYLGRFSLDRSRRARDRQLWMYDTRAAKAIPTTAAKVANKLGLYDASNWAAAGYGQADAAWLYEARLPQGLDALESADELDGILWLEVLVPFIAGLLMRGPDFEDWFIDRFEAGFFDQLTKAGAPVDPKRSAQGGRFIDLQMLLAPLMAMDWAVLRFPEDVQLLTTDRAYTPALSPIGFGLVVPLGLRSVLVLSQGSRRTLLLHSGERWVAQVRRPTFHRSDAIALRRLLAASAIHAVYGPTREVVEEAADAIASQPAAPAVPTGSVEPIDEMCHMYDYFRVVSVVKAGPNATQDDANVIRWDRVTAWNAPVLVELLAPERTRGGVRLLPGRIHLSLTFGAVLRRLRRLAGDPRKGAYAFMSLSQIQRREQPTPDVRRENELSLAAQVRTMGRRDIVAALVAHASSTIGRDSPISD